jgi:hypothetical protein
MDACPIFSLNDLIHLSRHRTISDPDLRHVPQNLWMKHSGYDCNLSGERCFQSLLIEKTAAAIIVNAMIVNSILYRSGLRIL